ncbi:MAG TPA: sulfite exporter TauE/SafE family protein [Candidatus Hydrogenedentes bacterium]|nr:sulfite exporter TauE/SafE family protein [Candidatus Hydrogenedentota bacterium]HOS03351.1 sulfite exporter TauE/SafE family protein [Candidatus Hydrogenedentota bacterium]
MFDDFIAPGMPQPVFWLFVSVAIIIQGVSKSGFAGGVGILSLPLMMLVMPSQRVAGVMLPLLILLDLNAIYIHRHNKQWKPILALYVPAVAGILAGAALWWWIGKEGAKTYDVPIKRFVGVIAIVFSLYIVGKEHAGNWVKRITPGPVFSIVAGLSAGFCSTLAHAAGPIVGLYMFAQGMSKNVFVGTTAWMFTLLNITKLPFYFAVGLVETDVLLFDLSLVWLIPIGSYLGKWMHHRVSERLFNRIILFFTLLAALQLLTDINLVQRGLELAVRRHVQ